MTTILLAEPQTRKQLRQRLRDAGHAALAERLAYLDPDGDDDQIIPGVCGARTTARELIAAHTGVKSPIQLDGRHVAVITPSFVDELLRVWPDATFVNLDPDSEEVVGLVRRRRKRQGR